MHPSSEAVGSPPDSFTAAQQAPEPITQYSRLGAGNGSLGAPQQMHSCCCQGATIDPTNIAGWVLVTAGWGLLCKCALAAVKGATIDPTNTAGWVLGMAGG